MSSQHSPEWGLALTSKGLGFSSSNDCPGFDKQKAKSALTAKLASLIFKPALTLIANLGWESTRDTVKSMWLLA